MNLDSLRNSIRNIQLQARNSGASGTLFRPRTEDADNTGNSTLDLSKIGQRLLQNRQSGDTMTATSHFRSAINRDITPEQAVEALGLEFEEEPQQISTGANSFRSTGDEAPDSSILDAPGGEEAIRNRIGNLGLTRVELDPDTPRFSGSGPNRPQPGSADRLTRIQERLNGTDNNTIDEPGNEPGGTSEGRARLDTLDPEFAARFKGLSYEDAAGALRFLNASGGGQDEFSVLTGANGQLIHQKVAGGGPNRIFSINDTDGLVEHPIEELFSIYNEQEQRDLGLFFEGVEAQNYINARPETPLSLEQKRELNDTLSVISPEVHQKLKAAGVDVRVLTNTQVSDLHPAEGVIGFFSPADNEVVVNIDLLGLEAPGSVITHEVGHAFDFNINNDGNWYSLGDRWKQLLDSNPQWVNNPLTLNGGGEGDSRYIEGFARAFNDYFLQDELQARNPAHPPLPANIRAEIERLIFS